MKSTEEFKTREFVATGTNWGEYDMTDSNLVIKGVNTPNPIMAIPYSSIANSNATAKNEVTVEFT